MKAEIEEFSAKNPNPVLSVAKDGTVLYSNKAGEPLLQEWGVELGEKLPSDIKELVQGVISRNSPEKIEVKAGDRLFLVVFSSLPEQNCVNISGFDISGQKVLEEKLRESEEKYRIVADNTYDWEFWIDPDGRFQYTSPSCERVTGYAAQEFMDKPDLLQEIIHQDDRQTFLQHKWDILQSQHGDIEFRIITKGGKIRWIHHVCQPVYDNKGCYAGNRGSNRDITDRKLAEEMVQGARDMLWLVMDNIPQGIFWKDRNSRYLGCNKVFAKAAGLESPKNIVGKTDHDMPWLPEQTKLFHEYDHKVMESDTPEYQIVESQQEADGKLAWIETNKIPLHDTKGNVIGILGTYEDITERKKAEETIKEKNLLLYQAQEFLEAVTKGTGIIIATIDTNFCYKYFNKAYQEEVKRHSGKEIKIGTSMIETFAHLPEQQKIVIEEWNEVLKGKSSRKTMAFGNPDLYQKTYDILHTPILDAEGKIIGAGEVAYDVTEKVRVEKALRKSKARIESIFRSSPVGIGVVVNRMIKEANNRLCEMTGYSREELLEKSSLMLYPTVEEYERVGLVKYNMISERGTGYVETRWQRKDGSIVDILLSSSPIIPGDLSKEITFSALDITERKQHEEALKKANEKLEEKVKERTKELQKAYNSLKESEESLIEAQKIAHIGSWDNNLVIGKLHWSEEMYHIFGLNPQEPMTYDKFLSCIHPDDRDYVYNSTREAFNGNVYMTEYRIVRPNGEERIVQSEREVFFDENNKPIRMTGTIQDITERKKTEADLSKMEKIRIKEIHHRIKNNLQVISSLLDLQKGRFSHLDICKVPDVIEAFTESQNRVISMALIHEKLYKGGDIETLNFSGYIKDLTDNLFLTYQLGNVNISLSIDIDDDIFFDMDTAVPLGIIVNELVSNALKHAFSDRDKGKIIIELHREKCKIEDNKSTLYTLSVSDNGIGIPEYLEIDDIIDTLGMQLVNSLVDQLDGKLELKRDNGTEFIIKFTVTEETNQAHLK